jgi:hypothetical protein
MAYTDSKTYYILLLMRSFSLAFKAAMAASWAKGTPQDTMGSCSLANWSTRAGLQRVQPTR